MLYSSTVGTFALLLDIGRAWLRSGGQRGANWLTVVSKRLARVVAPTIGQTRDA